jgi:hypothetical protein
MNLALSTEEIQTVNALIGASKLGFPVPNDFVVPPRLVSLGLITFALDGQPSVTDDAQWRLVVAGLHPSFRRW